MDATATRARILCVDDEANVLAGLSVHLHRRYDVVTATSGAAGLATLGREPAISIVVSDMRIPGMSGTEFLAKARQLRPDAVRLLLTGHLDLDAAIAAVNEGQVFRFLTKPCPPATLLAALAAASEQHRLVTAERVLLEQTLRGSIQTLVDVLAITNPAAFGRATRIQQHASEIAVQLGMEERWQLEVAALLSQLGCITLPADTAERACYGQPLSEAEQAMVAHVPAVTEQLLANIPRLEPVREILAAYPRSFRADVPPDDPRKAALQRAAHVLRVAVDFDLLESQGHDSAIAVDTLRGRHDHYDPAVVAALVALRAAATRRKHVREVPIAAVGLGMVFAEDVRLASGTLLVARGYEVTQGFLERIRNFSPGTVKEPVRVVLSTGLAPIVAPALAPAPAPRPEGVR